MQVRLCEVLVFKYHLCVVMPMFLSPSPFSTPPSKDSRLVEINTNLISLFGGPWYLLGKI